MEIINSISEILGLIGLGALIAIPVQFYINKKLKIFETKLIIFRRVYKQLYHLIHLYSIENQGGVSRPIDGFKTIKSIREECELDLNSDLGDILFYVDGKLKDAIEDLINNLYYANSEYDELILQSSDRDNIYKIQKELKEFFKKDKRINNINSIIKIATVSFIVTLLVVIALTYSVISSQYRIIDNQKIIIEEANDNISDAKSWQGASCDEQENALANLELIRY